MKKIIVAMIWVLALSLGWGECSLAQAQDLSGSLYQQGLQLFHKKDFAGAVDYLGQVCDMVDTHHEARYYLIFSLTSLRRYREALLHAETLVQQKPDEERYQKVLAQVQEIIGGSKIVPQTLGALPTSLDFSNTHLLEVFGYCTCRLFM